MASSHSALESDSESSNGKSGEVVRPDNFPSKTYLVIDYCDRTDSDVACWSDDGTFFVVKNTAEFASSYLPQYFKHSNFQSFVRQLNIYGWRTVKEHESVNGSVAFHHKSFLRGGCDLLQGIKRRSKSTTSKKQHPEEGKKLEDEFSFNSRFDEMQEQMDSLSAKLDLLISLVSAKQGDYVDGTSVGGKRRRQVAGDGRASPFSDVTDPDTSGSKPSSSSSSSTTSSAEYSREVAASVPRLNLGMDVIYEEGTVLEPDHDTTRRRQPYLDLMELQESTIEQNETHQQRQAALGVCYEEHEHDDFKEFIETILSSDDEDAADEEEHGQVQDNQSEGNFVLSMDGSNALVGDPLMSKANPDTVQGHVHIPQTIASSIAPHSNEVYDEESGEKLCMSSPPLTTAVEATDASTASRKPSRRRLKIGIAVAVLMILAAFIVWPVVVMAGRNKKDENLPPPPRPRPPRPGGRGEGAEGGERNQEKKNKNAFDNGTNQSQFLHPEEGKEGQGHVHNESPDSGGKNDGIPLTLAMNGQSYQCLSIPSP